MTAEASRASRPLVGAGLQRYLRAFRRPNGLIGGGLLVALVALALLAPVIFPGGVDQQSRNSFLKPSLAHPFGTDKLGRDLLVRCIYALGISISLVVVAVPIAMVAGTLMGLAGAVSRGLGNVFQRLFDIILGFPGIVIAIIIGPGWVPLAVTIAIFVIPNFDRLARGALLTEEGKEYVLAARVLGVSTGRIMTRHILPNTLDPLIVQMSGDDRGHLHRGGAVDRRSGHPPTKAACSRPATARCGPRTCACPTTCPTCAAKPRATTTGSRRWTPSWPTAWPSSTPRD